MRRRGGPHWASPDKLPARRLETMRLAGELVDPVHERDPDRDRRDARGADRRAARAPVAGRRARPPARGDRPELPREAGDADGRPSGRVARGAPLVGRRRADRARRRTCHVQAPPNLAYDDFPLLLDAGIDDWGGVSPVTLDHVNPEAPWPAVERLREACRSRGLELAPRLPLYPEHVADLDRWADPAVAPAIRRAADAARARPRGPLGARRARRRAVPRRSRRRLRSSSSGDELGEEELVRLFAARGRERERVLRGGRPASARGVRRRGDVRRHAERPVHERLLLPVRLLRLLEGQARREPARAGVPRAARRDRASRPRGVGARRDGGLPPGRDPPVVHRRLLRERRRDDQGRGARDPRARVLRARDLAGRGDARARPRDVPRRGSATSASARSRARPPRSSTTRCARSSAPTR